MKNFHQRTTVITGAASGIGFQLARAFAAKGAHLALVDLDMPGLETAQRTLSTSDNRVTIHTADVSNYSALQQLHDDVLREHGAVHILVNNAGLTVYGCVDALSREQIDRQLGVNLNGVIYGTQIFLPTLKKQDEAHIVNMASMASLAGIPMQSIYCATKAGVRAFSQAISAECTGTQVGVSWVLPGAIRTPFLENVDSTNGQMTGKLDKLLQRYAYPPESVAKNIVAHVGRGGGELLQAPDAYLTYYAQRFAPRLVAASMRSAKRQADAYARRQEKSSAER